MNIQTNLARRLGSAVFLAASLFGLLGFVGQSANAAVGLVAPADLTGSERLLFVPTGGDISASAPAGSLAFPGRPVTGLTEEYDFFSGNFTGYTIGDQAEVGDFYLYEDVHPCGSASPTCFQIDAKVTVTGLTNAELNGSLVQELDELDEFESDPTDPSDPTDNFLRLSVREELPGYAIAELKVEFFAAGSATPASFASIALNAYDVDNSQYVELDGFTDYQLTSDSIIGVTDVGPGKKKFLSADSGTTSSGGYGSATATSYTKGRVKVNYSNVSVINLTAAADGGSFEFDFGPGVAWGLTGSTPPAPRTEEPRTSAPTGPVVIDVNPTQITMPNEIVTIFGARLDCATDVVIGGLPAKIIASSSNRISAVSPNGLVGPVDLVIVCPSDTLTMTDKLNYELEDSSSYEAQKIVGGFAANSTIITKVMKKKIRTFMNLHPTLKTVTCKGFTSLPVTAWDLRLSKNRGVQTCDYIKAKYPEVSVNVLEGSHTESPGLQIRRVRIGLSK